MDRGFLVDPDSQLGHALSPDVVPFERIASKPCLVLLGEPGIGKTTAMKDERQAIEAQERAAGDDVWPLDLSVFGTRAELSQALFEDPRFHSWVKGGHVLHLFLDALDECRLEIRTVAKLLGSKFEGLPVAHLRLRIACRTAEWPASLEATLKARWGEDQVGVYELVPLRFADVAEAARANGLEPDEFLKAVAERNVESLAAKPVTLELLLRKYKEVGDLPDGQLVLYREGCRLLCEEVNPERRDAGHTGNLDADQRLAVAARIAALMFFGNRSGVWIGTALECPGEECITLRELSCRGTPLAEAGVDVNEETLREVLDTGLFTSRGPERIGWAHQTYGEFLAADYLVRRGLTVAQTMSLIRHPSDPDGRLAPQLHGVAAWLAAMVPEIFAEVVKHEPEILAQSDVATDTVEQRSALVDAVLSLLESDPGLLHQIGMHHRNLAHPGLAGQLRPWLVAKSKEMAARYTAIEMAQACELGDVQKEIADIALDPKEEHYLRVNAAYAISEMEEGTFRALLRPLALGQAGPDPNDELKGCALRALWPGHMTSGELFASLTTSGAKHGAYWTFLCLDLPRRISLADLPAALEWVARQSSRFHLPFTAGQLMDAIMWLAWQHIEDPTVAEGFAAAVLSQAAQYEHKVIGGENADRFRNELQEDDGRRHCLLAAMVPLLGARAAQPHVFPVSVQNYAFAKDVPWLMARLGETDDTNQQKVLAEIARWVFDIGDAKQVERIHAAYRTYPVAKEVFGRLIEPVRVDSAEAKEARKQIAKRRQFEQEMSSRVARQSEKRAPDPRNLVDKSLIESESGDPIGWWRLTLYMTLDENGEQACTEYESDLKKTPGWKSTDVVNRAKMVEAAKQYVLEPASEATAWLPGHAWDRPTLAVYKAFGLLLSEDAEWVHGLSGDVWRRWAPVIAAYPLYRNEHGDIELISLTYRHAAEEVLRTVRTLIRDGTSGNVAVAAVERLESCWDESLATCAVEKLRDLSTDVPQWGSLLNMLLGHRSVDGEAFARSLVSAAKPTAEDQRPRTVLAAYMLLRHAANAGWDVVLPAMRADPDLCDSLATRLADDLWVGVHQEKADTPLDRLGEEQLSDLFRLLVERYPYSTHHTVAGNSINNRAHCRDAVLGRLENRGTLESVRRLEQLVAERPDLRFLALCLRKARYLARQATWRGWQPNHILALAQSREKRLVENGRQLLDVIVESLVRLQQRLQGERAIVDALWNNPKQGLCGPKDEPFLSDFVVDHLGRDLRERHAIVNREPEIRRGKETDIRVDALLPGRPGETPHRITVIVEVKGCWHRKLKTAMQSQLVGQYMRPNGVEDGLYLVGWFNCKKWDDGRQKFAPKMSADEARDFFNRQAAELSQDGLNVKAVVLDTALT
jgi:hypothetical protein